MTQLKTETYKGHKISFEKLNGGGVQVKVDGKKFGITSTKSSGLYFAKEDIDIKNSLKKRRR